MSDKVKLFTFVAACAIFFALGWVAGSQPQGSDKPALSVEATQVADIDAAIVAAKDSIAAVQFINVVSEEPAGPIDTTPKTGQDAWPSVLTSKEVKSELAQIDAIMADNWTALSKGDKFFGPSDKGSISDVVEIYIMEVAANGHKAEAQKRLDDLKDYVTACRKAGVELPSYAFTQATWVEDSLVGTQAFVNACK